MRDVLRSAMQSQWNLSINLIKVCCFQDCQNTLFGDIYENALNIAEFMFLFLFCKKMSIFQTTLEYFPHSYARPTAICFFTYFHKKTRKNLLRVSRLFSTSRFCSDVTIRAIFFCMLACHLVCIYYTHMRTPNTFIQYMKSSTKCLIPNSCAFPTTIYQIPSKTFSTSCFYKDF